MSKRWTSTFLTLIILFSTLPVIPPQPVLAATPQAAAMRLIRSDESGIVLELATTAFTLVESAGVDGPCQSLAVAGLAPSSVAGAPQLPAQVALLGVPAEGELTISATPLESETLAGVYHLCPAAKAVAEDVEGESPLYVEKPASADAAIYALDTPYPAQAARLEEVGFLRSQRLARAAIFPFQVNPVSGALIYHRRLQVVITFSTPPSVRAAAISEAPQVEQTLASLLTNYASARTWRSEPPVQAASAPMWRPPAESYRVAIADEGLYALTYAQLAAAGAPVGDITPTQFHLYNDGNEVAIRVTGAEDDSFDAGDAILFYGAGVKERYNHTNIYWLAVADQPGKRIKMAAESTVTQSKNFTRYTATARYEENREYVSSLPMQAGYDHWYGSRITAINAPANEEFTLPIDNLATANITTTVRVALAGNTIGAHHVRLFVNDTQVYDGVWNGRTYTELTADVPVNLLVEGANILRVALLNDVAGQVIDMVYVDWVALDYPRRLVGEQDQLSFTNAGSGNWRYTLSGFNSSPVEVYNITDPGAVIQLPTETVTATVAFRNKQGAAARFLAVTPAHYRTALSITAAHPTDLLTPESGADYIIISHADFLGAIQPLADHRSAEGYRVRVVDVQDIYDHFNGGRVSADAIHDFLAYAYNAWPAPAPQFVLLVGDGTYDPLGYLATGTRTYVPPMLAMVDPIMGETASDTRFATVAGDDVLPDLYVGRFPAQRAADVTAMVDKTLAYEQTTPDMAWTRHLLFVSDNLKGGGGSFYDYSDAIADGSVTSAESTEPLVPDDYTRTKLYLGRDCPDEKPAATCRQAIIDQMNQGALFVSYIGHGAKQYWAEEQLLNIGALDVLQNGANLPIMLAMTCIEGYFHDANAGFESFGESIVKMAERGAAASWSPTGFGLVTGHDYLETGFMVGVFHAEVERLGPATAYAQLYLLANAPLTKYDDLLDTFILFGDPALRIPIAQTMPPEEMRQIFLPLVTR